MSAVKDITGQRFGGLTVLQRFGTSSQGTATWLCLCDCGKECVIEGAKMRKGNTRSCGCLRDEKSRDRLTTHGMSGTRLYHVWKTMNQRCSNPNSNDYKDYGGRGITVCEEWQLSFPAFHAWAIANGYDENAPQSQCTIDRINNDGGYSPQNCRWVDQKTQCNNKTRKKGYKMTNIKLNRLTIENFKKISLLNLVLNGRDVNIYGDNATGKTTVFDAFTWALFSKDSSGNGDKNFEVKPLSSSGEVKDHQAITSVEVEFDADGQIITFQRTYREIWATRRGTGTPVYEGNTSDYFVNGVPVKKNAYDAAIKELVSEELFRMLTNTTYFASGMKYQERRAVLFDMAGTLTDKEIMLQSEEFTPLLDSIGSLTLAEYKAKLLHQKKGQTGIQNDTPARINECERTLADIAGINFEEAREQEQALIAKRDGIHVQLMAMEQDSVLDKKRLDLREAKFERDQLEARNRAHRETQRSSGRDLNYLYNEISREQAAINQSKNYLTGAQRGIVRAEKEIQDCRNEWVQVNGEAFAGGKCPTCGQTLPFEQLQKSTETFNKRKQVRLDAITAKAKDLQENLEQSQKRNQEIQEEISRREAHILELEDQIRKAREEVAPITDLPEYAEGIAAANSRVDAIQAEISSLMADSSKVRDQLRSDLSAVEGQLRFVQGILAKEAIKAQTEKRIAELKADARNAAEILEKIEQMLYLMESFTRFKAKFVEESINDHFRIATFRLFREQANGGLEERCDVVYDGVPFTGLNNGMKVNVGIDIINALSRHYGVTVPLFVDNAEAVTRLEPCNAQVIRLVVSENDKELRTE